MVKRTDLKRCTRCGRKFMKIYNDVFLMYVDVTEFDDHVKTPCPKTRFCIRHLASLR